MREGPTASSSHLFLLKRKRKKRCLFLKLSFVQKCFREVEGGLPIIHAFVDGSMNSFQVEKSPLLLFCTDAGYSARGPEEEEGGGVNIRWSDNTKAEASECNDSFFGHARHATP